METTNREDRWRTERESSAVRSSKPAKTPALQKVKRPFCTQHDCSHNQTCLGGGRWHSAAGLKKPIVRIVCCNTANHRLLHKSNWGGRISFLRSRSRFPPSWIQVALRCVGSDPMLDEPAAGRNMDLRCPPGADVCLLELSVQKTDLPGQSKVAVVAAPGA